MARSFNGTTDVVYRNNADMEQAAADFTASIWAYPTSEGEGGAGRFFMMAGNAAGVDTRWSVLFFDGAAVNRPRWEYHAGAASRIVQGADNDVTLNQWDFWTIRYRRSAVLMELLKNGTVLASGTADPGSETLGGDSAVGANNSADVDAFAGRLAHYQRWNVRLTDAEVAASRLWPGRVRPASLLIHWTFLGIPTTEPDLSGNARSGTVTGTTQADHAPVAPMFGLRAGWQGAFTAAVAAEIAAAIAISPVRTLPQVPVMVGF